MFIAIVGGSSSGKTTVSSIINNHFSNSACISMDNFYRTLTEEERKNISEYNFDLPSSFDNETFYNCLSNLKKGIPVDIPVYDFVTHKQTQEKITIFPNDIIIVEGIFVLEEERVRNLFDIKIFVDATPEIRITRRLSRDVKKRGRDIDSVILQYNKFVQPSYDKYIRPLQRYVDIIIPNNDHNNFIGVDLLIDAIKLKLYH